MFEYPDIDIMQMARIVEDTRAIERIMGQYTFLNCYRRHGELFTQWSPNEPTLTLNDGKYIGYEAVKGFLVDYNDQQTRWANDIMRKLHPQELGGKSDEEIWAVGSNTVLTMTTPLIEIALDGKTAKGLWYIYGETTEVYGDGPKASWNMGKCGVDFIKEDGVWKIWHMTMFTDFACPLGGNWGVDQPYAHEGVEPPKPTLTENYYQSYSAEYVSALQPKLPVPYDTFANTFSY